MPSVTSSQPQPGPIRLQRSGLSLSGWEDKSANSNRKTVGDLSDLTVEISSTTSIQDFINRKDKIRASLGYDLEDNKSDEEVTTGVPWHIRIVSPTRKVRQDVFATSSVAHRRSSNENNGSPVRRRLYATSSVTIPLKSGPGDRVPNFLTDDFQGHRQRSGVLLEFETNLADDVITSQEPEQPTPQQPPIQQQQPIQDDEPTQEQSIQQQQQLQSEESQEASANEKLQWRRNNMERLVDRRSHMGRLSSLAPNERNKDSGRPQQAKQPTSPKSKPKRKKSSSSNSDGLQLLQLSRQVRLGRQGEHSYFLQRRTNRIVLHVYDLMSKDTVMMLPFGCNFPIGKVFNVLNSGLHSLGTGAYHVGVEVNGTEYAYGACKVEGTSGVFACAPKCSPGYQYRTSIDLGERELRRRCWVSVPRNDTDVVKQRCWVNSPYNPADGVREFANGFTYREVETFVEGSSLIKEMAYEYMGKDYDLLRRNCCTFAMDVCKRLGVKEEEVPSWFRNLADAGAKTKDVAFCTSKHSLRSQTCTT